MYNLFFFNSGNFHINCCTNNYHSLFRFIYDQVTKLKMKMYDFILKTDKKCKKVDPLTLPMLKLLSFKAHSCKQF